MKELLIIATENAVVVIYGMALLVVMIGTVEAFVSAIRAVISPRTFMNERTFGYASHVGWSRDSPFNSPVTFSRLR